MTLGVVRDQRDVHVDRPRDVVGERRVRAAPARAVAADDRRDAVGEQPPPGGEGVGVAAEVLDASFAGGQEARQHLARRRVAGVEVQVLVLHAEAPREVAGDGGVVLRVVDRRRQAPGDAGDLLAGVREADEQRAAVAAAGERERRGDASRCRGARRPRRSPRGAPRGAPAGVRSRASYTSSSRSSVSSTSRGRGAAWCAAAGGAGARPSRTPDRGCRRPSSTSRSRRAARSCRAA